MPVGGHTTSGVVYSVAHAVASRRSFHGPQSLVRESHNETGSSPSSQDNGEESDSLVIF